MSRRRQLLSFGNALVDLEFTITEEELHAIGIRKSGMTLAHQHSQQVLLTKLLQQHSARLSSGGSAANTTIAFAQFGGSAAYISSLGKDEHGSFFTQEFRELGVDLFAEHIPGMATGTCIVLITPDGERTMQTCLGASDAFEVSMLRAEWFDWTEWFYAEGYKLTSPHGAVTTEAALYWARKKGVFTALSLSDAFVATTCKDIIKTLLPQVDMLFCNDREAMSFLGVDNAEEAFQMLCAYVPNLVFTLGPGGSLLYIRQQTVRIPAYPTTVVDTNGAGDMYAGALLYGVLHGWNVEYAGHVASKAAAQIVAQYGARYHGNYQTLLAHAQQNHTYRDSDVSPLVGMVSDSEPKDATSSAS